MTGLNELHPGALSSVDVLLTDIDDTLTKDGKLSCGAYCALWDLQNAGVRVIPVTGRPAGWCDLIVRQWPVDAVIGENGALVFYLENGKRREMYHPSVDRNDLPKRFAEIEERVYAFVPGTRRAKDQFSRMFDLAIDFREEPPYLSFEDAEKIRRICEEMGAHAKVSSIHVNTWFGDYDKLSMAKFYLREHFGIDLDDPDQNRRAVFCGDSPNDEPMFRAFARCFAVANIEPFLPSMAHHPSFVTQKSHGEGFREIAAAILNDRKG